MDMIESQNEFLLLKRFVEQNLKIFCSNYKEDYIKRRFFPGCDLPIPILMQRTCICKNQPAGDGACCEKRTINVTEFFRDKGVFDAIKTIILPGNHQKSENGFP